MHRRKIISPGLVPVQFHILPISFFFFARTNTFLLSYLNLADPFEAKAGDWS